MEYKLLTKCKIPKYTTCTFAWSIFSSPKHYKNQTNRSRNSTNCDNFEWKTCWCFNIWDLFKVAETSWFFALLCSLNRCKSSDIPFHVLLSKFWFSYFWFSYLWFSLSFQWNFQNQISQLVNQISQLMNQLLMNHMFCLNRHKSLMGLAVSKDHSSHQLFLLVQL